VKPNEILLQEDLCIEEHMPYCAAECPVHFDARQMCSLIQKKDYKSAYELYKKAVVFPEIVSSGCDAPCEKKCKRDQIGGSIKIKELERFIAEYGSQPAVIPEGGIKISKRIAFVGDRLDSRAIIFILTGKGYEPDLFVQSNKLEIESNDFTFLDDNRIKKHFGFTPDAVRISELANTYDAVYFSGYTENEYYTVYNDVPENPGFYFTVETDSIIKIISHGKQTAVTIDRFLKNVSLTAGRKNEGSFDTKLYTSTEGIQSEEPVDKTDMIYTEEEAVREAERCIDCRCLECKKQCLFMEKYDKYPRKYIREVFNNITTIAVAGGMGFRKSTPAINACTMCGLCERICPNGIPMVDVTRSAREVLVSGKVMPPRYHDFPLRDMLYSNSGKVSFFRNPKGRTKSSFMFFPGCQLIASCPEYIKPSYEFLSEILNNDVGLMLGCCGAPAMWAGEAGVYKEVMERFKSVWEEAGKPVIITACPTCNREFSEAVPEAEIKTVWHYYSEFDFPRKDGWYTPENINVSVHDPCTSRYRKDMHDEIRSILKKSGFNVDEYDFSGDKTRCCGFGGLIGYGDALLAKEFAEKRLSETKDAIVTYCSVCRDVFANSKKPVYHILDIIYGRANTEKGLRKKTGISEKIKNRTELKNNLLREIWGEEPSGVTSEYDHIELVINEEVKQKLEDRLILDDNIRKVIFEAEKTGGKTINPKTGNSTASKKLGIVTYWVEYKKNGELFHIISAYSHRIQIVEGDMVFVGGGEIQQIRINETKTTKEGKV